MTCNLPAATLAALLTVPAVLAAAPAAAQPVKVPIPSDAVGEQDPAGTALVQAFQLFCLDHFPEPARIEAAAPGRLTPMPPARVRDYLHDDPGRGWTYRAADGEYVVTVEDPPFHTCAVRRTYGAPPRYRLPWLLATGTWAAAAGRGPFREAPPQVMRQKGMVIEARARLLPGAPQDVFMELRTTYDNGTIEERLARRAGGGP